METIIKINELSSTQLILIDCLSISAGKLIKNMQFTRSCTSFKLQQTTFSNNKIENSFIVFRKLQENY